MPYSLNKTIENIAVESASSVVEPERRYGESFMVKALPENAALIRCEVARLACCIPFTEQDIEDITLAVGEAASNAISHGSPMGCSQEVAIKCEQYGDRFVVCIQDHGHGFDPASSTCTSPCLPVEGGRGLFFMKLLMDEVDFSFDHGTTVRLVKKLKP
jgi:serine/threonine-protein kinase RsbW